MAMQVFESEQEAIDYANRAEFAMLQLKLAGLSEAHAIAVTERLLGSSQLSASDAGWMTRLLKARASFVRMAKP